MQVGDKNSGKKLSTSINRTDCSNKCRCCLSIGLHQHIFGITEIEMLKEDLNIIVMVDSRFPTALCSACHVMIKDLKQFRDRVIATEAELKQIFNKEIKCEVDRVQDQNDPLEMYDVKSEPDWENSMSPDIYIASDDATDIEICAVKTEIEHDDTTLLKENPTRTIEGGNLVTSVKTQKSVPISGENSHVIDKEIHSDHTYIETPLYKKSVLLVPLETTGSKLEREIELDISITAGKESKKHSFLDNNKVRSNIILLLKHSTILPFRNNFKSTYKCFYCEKLYIPFKELKEHVEKEHYDVTEATIEKVVKSLQNLIVTADISLLKCRLCNQEYKSIENLVEHLCDSHKKIYHQTDKKPSHGILGVDLSTDTLKCHLCDKDFAFFKNLSVHMNEHYGSFVCYVCGKKFLSEHRYKCHVFNAHTDKKTKCKHCGKVFSTEPSMAYHVRKEHLKRMIKCLKCSLTFPPKQYVKRLNHMAEAHGIKKPIFKCDTCGLEYANSASLTAHKRNTHKRTKEHKCDICGYITLHNYVMKRHMDVHNGIKNYECEFCKKKFAKLSTLKLHLKIHLNDKRFKCTLCDAAFIQKNSLKSHLKSRHPDSGIDINKL